MDNPIQPIETLYEGVRFRSRLEARWAVFFDRLGIKWHYEHEGYETPFGRYLPDFWLPNVYLRHKDQKGVLLEIKPAGWHDDRFEVEKYTTVGSDGKEVEREHMIGNTQARLQYVANQLKVAAVFVRGFEYDMRWHQWEGLEQIAPWWDDDLMIYVCTKCKAVKFEYPEGSYMECPVCGHDDYDGRTELVTAAAEFAQNYRFW